MHVCVREAEREKERKCVCVCVLYIQNTSSRNTLHDDAVSIRVIYSRPVSKRENRGEREREMVSVGVWVREREGERE